MHQRLQVKWSLALALIGTALAACSTGDRLGDTQVRSLVCSMTAMRCSLLVSVSMGALLGLAVVGTASVLLAGRPPVEV